jgi:hypothetical protein
MTLLNRSLCGLPAHLASGTAPDSIDMPGETQFCVR